MAILDGSTGFWNTFLLANSHPVWFFDGKPFLWHHEMRLKKETLFVVSVKDLWFKKKWEREFDNAAKMSRLSFLFRP